jgi:hypothetical protein
MDYIPDGVIGFSISPNPSSVTVNLISDMPLTETGTTNLPKDVSCYLQTDLTAISEPIVYQCEILEVSKSCEFQRLPITFQQRP